MATATMTMNNNNKSPYYGWYSESEAVRRGSIVLWSTPDGGRVVVTSVSPSETQAGSFYDDIRLVGPVVEYVCREPYEPPSLRCFTQAVTMSQGFAVAQCNTTWRELCRNRFGTSTPALSKSHESLIEPSALQAIENATAATKTTTSAKPCASLQHEARDAPAGSETAPSTSRMATMTRATAGIQLWLGALVWLYFLARRIVVVMR
ncbi:hypothetical protein pqer_cds_706 [Pandoravirus quercus]|uniref:Uncharacterized protein n=2 Tax=Pandoravirus TaxID=2060084 RepID=A0A2U7U9J8_9VIRU|nr:hypothetical protein pqer_cds_706 [Pandoravirus quercus]AVK75128.1 hypothetical protein pqer_cds_706 [Pandoravirus quercus]QBZ81291.1 hypothetical protein pclt_cds_704 [Pandoravirus celtis]